MQMQQSMYPMDGGHMGIAQAGRGWKGRGGGTGRPFGGGVPLGPASARGMGRGRGRGMGFGPDGSAYGFFHT